MDLQDWLEYGRAKGFTSKIYCDTHDGVPMTQAELSLWDEGEDPCHHSVRIIGHDESLKELAREINPKKTWIKKIFRWPN